jgi:hypothetical protein
MVSTSLAPDGLDLSGSWAAVAGATSVEVTAAQLMVSPLAREVVRSGVPISAVAGGYQASSDGSPVRALGLAGLASGSRQISTDGDLAAAGLRLVVAVPLDGSWIPAYGAPGDGLPTGVQPATLAAGVLHLRDVALASMLVYLTGSGSMPFTPAPISLTGLSMTTLARPSDVAATLGGAPVWSAPGPLMKATGTDLSASARIALTAALASPGAALPVPLRLTWSGAGDVDVTWPGPHGALLRTVASPVVVTLTGDPRPMILAPAPAAEQPGSVTADITLTYLGVRLHDAVDEQPVSAGPPRGPIVGSDPVLRRLAPTALNGSRPAAIGLVGRAAEDADLTISLVDPSGHPVAPAGTVSVAAAPDIATVWAPLPASAAITGPVTVSVRATRGVFLWVADPDPLVRVAVAADDPLGRPVLLDGAALAAIDGTQLAAATRPSAARGITLPAAAFAGRLPVLSSRLFVRVRFDRLTLRYLR